MSESCHIRIYDIVKGGKIDGINENTINFSKMLKKYVSWDLISIFSPDTQIWYLTSSNILLSTSMTFNVTRMHQKLLLHMLYAFYCYVWCYLMI